MKKEAALEAKVSRQNQHTPGPWTVGPAGTELSKALSVPVGAIVVGAKQSNGSWGHVASCRYSANPEADACLIAAAPELLEACKAALQCSPQPVNWIQIEAAIAKAEGK